MKLKLGFKDSNMVPRNYQKDVGARKESCPVVWEKNFFLLGEQLVKLTLPRQRSHYTKQ